MGQRGTKQRRTCQPHDVCVYVRLNLSALPVDTSTRMHSLRRGLKPNACNGHLSLALGVLNNCLAPGKHKPIQAKPYSQNLQSLIVCRDRAGLPAG